MIEVLAGILALLACVSVGLGFWRIVRGPASRRLTFFLRILLLVSIVVPLLSFAGWRLSNSRDYQVCGDRVKRVDTARPLVALTFDDGPTAECTGEILDVLREKNVKATLFLTGNEIERHMPEAARIVADGHELGNHSFSHRPMVICSMAFIRDEIERTDELIRRSGYQGAIHFRPPYSKRLLLLPFYLWRTGRAPVLFDVEPESFPEIASSASLIVSHVTEKTRPGSIILLHLMYPRRTESRKALPLLIDALREKGYEFVRLSDLLALRAETGGMR